MKKDGRREPFDRLKIMSGLKRACEKRPIATEELERIADGIEARLQEEGRKEVPSREIGEAVMEALRDLDVVAYVRFASVYRDFRGVDEFTSALRDFLGRTGVVTAEADRVLHGPGPGLWPAGGRAGRAPIPPSVASWSGRAGWSGGGTTRRRASPTPRSSPSKKPGTQPAAPTSS